MREAARKGRLSCVMGKVSRITRAASISDGMERT